MSTKYRFQTIFLSVLILTSLFAFVIPFQNTFEAEYTKSISPPPSVQVLTFRDINGPVPTPDPTISFDKASYQIGDTATITITDFNANLDLSEVDFTSATVTMSSSTTVTLTETDGVNPAVNTGVFSGTFTVDAAPSVEYKEAGSTTHSSTATGVNEAVRATISLPAATGVSVTLSDEPFNENLLANLNLKPVVSALEVKLSSATFSSLPTVTISYANGNLDGGSESDLKMYHRAPCPPGGILGCSAGSLQGWELASTSVNTADDEITSDPSSSAFNLSFEDGQGRYVLAFDVGFGGGGGGGLVRPGLVVNALGGIGGIGGGGGGLPGPTIGLGAVALSDRGSEIISLPQEIRDFINDDFDPHTPLEPIIDIYEDFDLPLSINGNGFVLARYENTLVPQTVEPGEPIEFKLVFYTNSGVAYTSLNFNLGPTRTIAGSDTQVLLYKDKPVEIIDPNGNIATATGSINNEGDLKRVATFSITFSDSVKWPTSDFVIRSWTNEFNSGDIIVYDAISVTSSEIVEIADKDIPEPEIQTLKSQHVPIWIKNNAAWWSQELIEDSDFVAGIEYLIQNEIITIQDNQVIASSYSSNEIPEWIKNNAGWWSEDLITEKEFIDGLQWLIGNGIIQVTET